MEGRKERKGQRVEGRKERKGHRVEGRKEREGGWSVRYMYTVNL